MAGTKLVAEGTQNVILILCPTLQYFFHKVELVKFIGGSL